MLRNKIELPTLKLIQLTVVVFFCTVVLWSSASFAQSLGTTETPLQNESTASERILESAAETPTTISHIEPFGANLFSGGFSSEREDGLNPDYLIVPGDQISLSIWGAFEYNDIALVDPQGNIFVPNVGPVPVAGVSNADLNDQVLASVRTVFTDNVNVYTSLTGTRSVAVFVTGYVNQPGRFAGIPANSPLYFLDKAQGVDAEKGSYRRIKILRANETVAEICLLYTSPSPRDATLSRMPSSA